MAERTGRRPLKVGLFLPFARSWAEMRRLAERAEAVGYDSVWVMDHLILGSPAQPEPVWEGWSLLAALAAATRRVELGTLVMCTSFRNPALLAKMADTVEEISGGRLILGLGAGWHEPEYRAFGYPFDHLASRFEEAFAVIRTLLRTGRIDHVGRYYEARDCVLAPRGPRPQGPPILVGAGRERMLHLTARYADMWNGNWYRVPEDATERLAALDRACADVGRDPASLQRTAGIRFDNTTQGAGGPGGAPTLDSPAAIADWLRGFAGKGFSHVQVRFNRLDLAAVESLAPALELLDRG
ncbi:MAG TPA: LLM class flavin-dependent oxidoreductase [Chloroflexota bacterium]|nr:LLM class flavin-dependent oxidoreductase [Chloroflexota bacterium]